MTANEPGELVETLHGAPEPVAFLVGSWNRFEVLDALRTASRTREELIDVAGVSRPTLSRILSDLTDRGWIRRLNDEFEATPEGEAIASEINQLVDNLDTIRKLDDELEWLPTDLLGFDLAHLADADILTPSPKDQTGPMRRLADRFDSTTELRVVATGVTYEVVESLCQACLAGELQLHCVLDDQAIQGVRMHDDLREMFQEMIETDVCETHRYAGTEDLVECNLLDDDAVMFCAHSEDGRPQGIVLSENETVRSWTGYYFERLYAESEPLQADAFSTDDR